MARCHIVDGRCHAAIGHMLNAHSGSAVQPLGTYVHGRACAGTGVAERLAGLGRSHHVGHAFESRGGMGHEQHGLAGGLHHGGETFQGVIGRGRREPHHHGGDGEGVGREQQRVAIGHGPRNQVVAHGAARPGPVVHHHGLAQTHRELFGEQARHGVRVTTCGIGDHHGDRPGGVVLCKCRTTDSGGKSQCCNGQALPTMGGHHWLL